MRSGLHALKSQEVAVSVGWIPSHSGTEYNESADLAAKTAFEKATVVSEGSVLLPAYKWLVTKQVNRRWQQRWTRSVTVTSHTHPFHRLEEILLSRKTDA